MIIKTIKYVKQEDSEVEIFIPQEKSYYFETGIRRSICIIPVWTNWNIENYNKPEEIWKLDVVCIYQSWENKIESFSVQISQIQDLYNSKTNSPEKSIVEFLYYNGKYAIRTKERFLEDYNKVISKFNNTLLMDKYGDI